MVKVAKQVVSLYEEPKILIHKNNSEYEVQAKYRHLKSGGDYDNNDGIVYKIPHGTYKLEDLVKTLNSKHPNSGIEFTHQNGKVKTKLKKKVRQKVNMEGTWIDDEVEVYDAQLLVNPEVDWIEEATQI